jgi:hypothetical protein
LSSKLSSCMVASNLHRGSGARLLAAEAAKARLLKRGSSLRYRRRSWRRSRRAPAPGSTVRNRVNALHGGCLARFLKPSFEGNDRRPKESPDLYCRDVAALSRRI